MSDAAAARGAHTRPAFARTAATVAGALLFVMCEPAGELYLVLGAVLAAGVLAWGWPTLTASPSPLTTRVGILSAVGAGVLAIRYAEFGPPLRHFPVALAVGLIVVFFGQLLRGDQRLRVSEALTGDLAAVALVASGLTLPSLAVIRVAERPVTIAMCAVAASVLAELVPARLRGLVLGVAAAAGAAAGVFADLALQTGDPAIAALLGAVAGLTATATRIALSELPGRRAPGMAVVSAAATVLATGLVIFALARLLL